jgi:peptidoglycan/LPS O-acetylase OafA/YrhL
VAILLVLLWHCVAGLLDQELTWARPVYRALNLTWTGVDLFFVLSGFLIGGIMMDHGAARNFLQVFYLRRTLRIFPIYYLLLLSFLVAHGLGLANRWPGLAEYFAAGPPWWAYVTFTQNFVLAFQGVGGPAWLSVTWSLAVEEQFYLCLPLVLFLTPRRHLAMVLGGLALAAPVLRILLHDLPPLPGYAAYLLMPARADALLLGVLGAWLIRQDLIRRWLETHRGLLYAVLAVFGLGVVALHQGGFGFLDFAMIAFGYAWMAGFYLAVVLIAATETRGPLAFVLQRPGLRYLGRISYCVYLIHRIVLALAHAILLKQAPVLRTWPDAWVTLAAVAVTVGLASLSWHCLESRLVELGHGFKYRHAEESPSA